MSGGGGDAFHRALDEARRMDRAPKVDGAASTRGPRMRAGVTLARAPGSGGEARFGLALGWTHELPDRPPREAPPPSREAARRPADTPAEIAAELGLGAALTLTQLTSRWRDFVWRNHPDRQPPDARERANARVAIANTLYERARRELTKRR
jgi:hypothetical protein